MGKRRTFIKGTIILIIAGVLSRIIGFFFRIFLSRTLGADGLGIYQLIFPIQGFCYALCAAGIQTVISGFVAANISSRKEASPLSILKNGLFLSVLFSISAALFLHKNAGWIAIHILSEKRCTLPLQYLSYSIPFSSIHNCICGYYYGYNKAGIPAFSQLLEQVVRVASTYLVWLAVCGNGQNFTPQNAVLGAIAGEIFSSGFCILTLNISKIHGLQLNLIKKIAKASVPLTSNRVMLSIFQSAEAILLPAQLKNSGLSSSDALSIYGILTGMALPFIMFPATITNSMSTLLLPAIAQADSDNNQNRIKVSTESSVMVSMILGILCTGIFYRYGKDMGNVLFNNATSGYYLMVLAWLCPFMYLSTTLSSILNGLGHTSDTFILNIISITIRILFTLLLVPKYGISAYLCGVLVSQFVLAFTHYLQLLSYLEFKFYIVKTIIMPITGITFSIITADIISHFTHFTGIINLFTSCIITVILFGAVMFRTLFPKKYKL